MRPMALSMESSNTLLGSIVLLLLGWKPAISTDRRYQSIKEHARERTPLEKSGSWRSDSHKGRARRAVRPKLPSRPTCVEAHEPRVHIPTAFVSGLGRRICKNYSSNDGAPGAIEDITRARSRTGHE